MGDFQYSRLVVELACGTTVATGCYGYLLPMSKRQNQIPIPIPNANSKKRAANRRSVTTIKPRQANDDMTSSQTEVNRENVYYMNASVGLSIDIGGHDRHRKIDKYALHCRGDKKGTKSKIQTFTHLL